MPLTSIKYVNAATSMNDIPAIKKVYEVLHKFLFTGNDQLKKSPTKTNKRPNEKSLIILGYSGWGSGQLEGEMERDHWILSDINLDITFDEDSKKKWQKAFKNSYIKI